jgi:hypothetical protein
MFVMMDNNVDIEVLVAEAEQEKPKSKRGGHRPGAGRPSLVRENKVRIEQGLEPIPYKKKLNKKAPAKRKSDAILPQSKKARHQEILAEMMTRKGKYIVARIIEKALDDEDRDQLECMKIVVDRILPKDYLMKANNKSNSIQIHISGVGQEVSIDSEEVMDADYEEVYEEDNE